MKQHSRKKAAKIILIALFCIIIFFMIFLVCLIHNASTYVEKKYNKDFKVISIKLPYYKDDSDFFDWPLLYRPGEFVPLILKIQKKIFLSYITRANFMMITSWKKLTDI